MAILIIHLSDIHFNQKSTGFADRADRIVDAALSPIAKLDDIHIVVSGDLADWGLDPEFNIGVKFLESTRAKIESRTGIRPRILFCAGNHDCNLQGDQSLRDVLVSSMRSSPERVSPAIAANLATPLARFRKVQAELEPEVVQCDVWRAEIEISGSPSLRYVLLNSSVGSLAKEQQGSLYIPVPPSEVSEHERRTVYVMHHPYNWFQPDNARELAQHASAAADLFLMGHEHEMWAQSTRELYEDTTVTYLKGHVLRDPDSDSNSAFQTILIDEEAGFLPRSYRWNEGRYESWEKKSLSDYQAWPNQNGARKLSFTNEAYRELASTGANFTHRRKDAITLPDIFVWPTIRTEDSNSSGASGMLPEDDLDAEAELINNYSELPPIVVIRGGEHSGKSALAKMCALSLSRKGIYPIRLTASNVSSWREKSLNERIDGVIDATYGRAQREEYKQLEPDRRILIIDDFDLAQVTAGYFDGLRSLRRTFGKIFLMLDFHPGLEMALNEFLRDECFVEASVFDILNTNYHRRLELIERWIQIGATDKEEDRKVMAAKLAKVVDETLGRNLVPAVPVFVLIILQRAELEQDLDTVVKSGSQGFLYESMIQLALSTKVKAFNVVTCLAYLTAFATHLKNAGRDFFSQSEFEQFHVGHCSRYALAVSVTQLQAQLVAADIFEDRGDAVRFKYPFHNYYFTARSLAQIDDWMLQEPEIDRLIEAIHTERNANILLFLAHLKRNPRIAEKILRKAGEMFHLYDEANFFSPLEAIDQYGSGRIREILFEGSRSGQLGEVQKDLLEAEASQHELAAMAEERLKQRLDDALSMNAAFKTLQVLGQILRNHAGEIERAEKSAIARACADLGLRVLGFLYKLTVNHGTLMLEFKASQIRVENPNISDVEIAAELESYLARFVTSITVGTLIKIANAIGAEDLAPTLEEVLGHGDSNRFVKLVTELEHFSEFPQKELLTYEEDVLAGGAYLPNAVMRRFIIRRFYLFPVRDELKRAVLQRFKIKALPFQFLEQRKLSKSS